MKITSQEIEQVHQKYQTKISPFVKKHIKQLETEKNQLSHKIQKQFTPSILELQNPKSFTKDPLSEEDTDIHPLPNIIHKYPNKILFLSTQECPVYCRYCTRKRMTLMSQKKSSINLLAIQKYILNNPKIQEVIFSGGDPLMLPNKKLFEYLKYFLQIQQIQFVRLHSRAITTFPERFTQLFQEHLEEIQLFISKEQFLTIVIHVNHAVELTKQSITILQKIQELGIPVYCQSVLLKDINDSVATLKELALTLYKYNIRFYYLHQLDQIEGSSHFEVPIATGKKIMTQLKNEIPSYCLPKYVLDSKNGKVSIV